MMKKLSVCLWLVLLCSVLFTTCVFAEKEFTDLSPDHWAYQDIQTLVADGTVTGFEDGSFRPNDTVTRAQFVTMLGAGPTTFEKDFLDVEPTYWGYEMVMQSGLEGKDGYFRPDDPIIRDDVIGLLWNRNGAVTDAAAPSIVTKQSANPTAAAWIYAYGVMIGDDGLHLRTQDALSRAEAASIIIRARNYQQAEKINFVDTVSPAILQKTFESFHLFDNDTYLENRVVTNGVMAKAALRLGWEEYTLSYRHSDVSIPFDNKYARDLNIVAQECLGADKANETFNSARANMQDTIAAVTFNAIRKAHDPLPFGTKNNLYPDAVTPATENMNLALSFAHQKGINFYADDKIYPDKPMTMKEFACLLLQLDDLIGLQSSNQSGVKHDERIEKGLDKYTDIPDVFPCVLESVPKEVYLAPFTVSNLTSAYDFAREYESFFSIALRDFGATLSQKSGVQITFTYYPSLVFENDDVYVIRAKCTVQNNQKILSAGDIFGTSSKLSEETAMPDGTYFVELEVPNEAGLVQLSSDQIYLTSFLK